MLKKILSLLIAILLHFALYAQKDQHSLWGEVLSSEDNHTPIIGAVVTLVDLQLNQQTDENGHFHFNHLPRESFLVKVHSLGYDDFEKK